MPPYFVKIIPVLIMFSLGYFSKKLRIFNSKDADRFLQLVLNVTLPALTLVSLASLVISIKLLYLIMLPIIIVFLTYIPAQIIVKKLNVPKNRKGTFMIGSLIINTGFVSTFIYAFFGHASFGYYSLFDLGNSLMIYIFAYYQAIKYGNNKESQLPLKKMLSLPPIWAIVAGLIINFLPFNLNQTHVDTLNYIGSPTMPLIIFSLGIYFHPKIANLRMTLGVISLRMILGFILGGIIINILGLKEPISHIVLICASAPVGFNTLIFAELEDLDREFAATIVSFSLILSLLFITFYSYFVL
ncbi:AEC family transporter [bacterium]|nr:AEC family transporter [bacterium]